MYIYMASFIAAHWRSERRRRRRRRRRRTSGKVAPPIARPSSVPRLISVLCNWIAFLE